MRILALFFLFGLVSAPASQARFFGLWSYDELSRKAELILIVSVSSVSERTGDQVDIQGKIFDSVSTTFEVKAVLKGQYEDDSLELNHLDYRQDAEVIFGVYFFQWFHQPETMFLAFLQKDDSGNLQPVTGQFDLHQSFYALPMDRATAVRQLLKDKDWQGNRPRTDQPDQTDQPGTTPGSQPED